MNKAHITLLATQIHDVKQSINDIQFWKERYVVRAMLAKIVSDSNGTYTVKEIEAMLSEI